MNLSSGYFPPNGYRRKQTAGSYSFSLNNQNHHPHTSSTIPSARSSIESINGNETFFSTYFSHDTHRPYRQNDFANNHLFLAKRKLASIFQGQSMQSLHSKSDLIHLFDHQEPQRKSQQSNKLKRQERLSLKNSSDEQDTHLSVVNLDIRPPGPLFPIRDPLSSIIRYRHSQSQRQPLKVSRQTTEVIKPNNFQSTSLHTFTDNHEFDESNDNDMNSDSSVLFDSSILTVKSIIPSIGPQHR